jgi:hypothetical protein
VAVVIAPLVVVVVVAAARQEALTLLLLLIHPGLHHVVKSCDGLWEVTTEVSEESLVSDAVVVTVDDVLLEDVGDGGVRLEEAAGVGAHELVTFLLALR